MLVNLVMLFHTSPFRKIPNNHFSNKIFHQPLLHHRRSNVYTWTEEFFILGALPGASLPVGTGEVCTFLPNQVLKIGSQSLTERRHTHIFGISTAVTATFANGLVSLQKHLQKIATSNTSIRNLFTSSLKQLKEPDISRKKSIIDPKKKAF